jgi:hypothetical protein
MFGTTQTTSPNRVETIMSIKSFDAALDFRPAARTGGPSPFETVRKVLAALREGLEAQANYRRNIARGMQPKDAAARAFEEAFKGS